MFTELLDKTGAFFAFGKAQFEEKRVVGVEYSQVGSGLIVPTGNAKELLTGMERVTKAGIELDLKENGREGIIRRELFNHECFYTGNIEDCVGALIDYGIQESEVINLYRKIRNTEDLEL